MKVKFGAIVTEARGKIGGHVFTRNTYANVMRTKVSPIQPRSSSQQVVKSSMTTAAQAWRGLADAARASFESLAQSVTRTNIFGDQSRLGGFALFVRLTREIFEVAGTPLTTAPAMPTMSSVTSLTLTVTGGTPLFSLAHAPTPIPAGFSMVIQATPQMSQGIMYAQSKFRTLAVVPAAGATPYVGTATYPAKFGTLVATNRIFVRAKLVHKLTGFSSGWFQTSAIVGA